MGFYPNLNKPKLSLKRHLKRVVEEPYFSKYREYANIDIILKMWKTCYDRDFFLHFYGWIIFALQLSRVEFQASSSNIDR